MSDNNVKQVGELMPVLLDETDCNCEKHGAYRGKPMQTNFFGKNRIIEPPCPACEKEEAEKKEAEKKDQNARNERLRKAEIYEKYQKMNIGEKFWGESFDTFKTYTDELKNYFNICKSFAEDHQGRMLVMLGNNGNGKDHLAISALKIIGGYMYSVFELEMLLRRCYTGKSSEWALFQRLCNAPLLVINEIGRHKAGDWELNFLSHIVNKRYENMKPLILITNKHLKDHCTEKDGCKDCLQNYIGNDIISRIIEGGEIMIFTGEDYRMKIREGSV